MNMDLPQLAGFIIIRYIANPKEIMIGSHHSKERINTHKMMLLSICSPFQLMPCPHEPLRSRVNHRQAHPGVIEAKKIAARAPDINTSFNNTRTQSQRRRINRITYLHTGQERQRNQNGLPFILSRAKSRPLEALGEGQARAAAIHRQREPKGQNTAVFVSPLPNLDCS
jgi:hypothetical protein